MDKATLLAAIAEHVKTEEGRQEVFQILNPKPKGAVRAYYFGVWGSGGHSLHDEHNGSVLLEDQQTLPWKAEGLDGGLCPQHGPQVEGMSRIHYKGGWTALAFWDRSGDRRINSNSVLLVEGIRDMKYMLEVGQTRFHNVWRRFKFEIRLASKDYGHGSFSG